MTTTTFNYRLYRNGRRYNNKLFPHYEAARNYVRKLVRSSKVNTDSRVNTDTNNIPLSSAGFSVKRVSA